MQHTKAFQAGKKSGQITKKKSFKAKPQKSLRFDPNPYGKGPEKKNADVATQNYNLPLTSSFGSVVLLNGIAQGVGNTERIGRRIAMKSLQLRYIHYSNLTAGSCRIVIFYDRQANSTTPSSGDIIGSQTFDGIVNLVNSDRFVILMDEISENAQFDGASTPGKRYIKMDLETIFSGTGSGISSVQTGAVFIMMANSATFSTGATSNATFSTRIRYTDA